MKKLKWIFPALLLWGLSFTIPCYGENLWLIRINIPEFKLYLYHAKNLYQKFDVAVGKQDTPSPLGDFWIVNKVLDPTWYPTDGRMPVPAGEKNPLGKYWLGLNVEGYGIHGNSAAWSIGTPASLGCFRLHNNDIKKLFELVPVGTLVQIVYETVHASVDQNNTAWIEAFSDIYHWNNFEAESARLLHELNWIYEPHWKALSELLRAKKPLKIEVPRVIRFDGETLQMDGFYWRQGVYISQETLETLAISLPAIGNGKEKNPFAGYVKLDLSGHPKDNSQWIWDNESNTLRLIRPKVFLNGMELSKAATWSQADGLQVDITAVAKNLGASFSWDYSSKAFICMGIMIAGKPRNGGFWVTPEQLKEVWGGMRYSLESKSETLELWTR